MLLEEKGWKPEKGHVSMSAIFFTIYYMNFELYQKTNSISLISVQTNEKPCIPTAWFCFYF